MNEPVKLSEKPSMEKGDAKHGEITHGTRFSLSLGITVGTVLFIGGGMYFGIKMEISKIFTEISLLRKQGDDFERAIWTRKDQEIFALRLRVLNPNLNVPEVREISTGGRL